MPGTDLSQLGDLLRTTRKEVRKFQVIQIAQKLQDYHIRRLLEDGSVKSTRSAQVQRNMVTKTTGNARATQYYDTSTPTVNEIHKQFSEEMSAYKVETMYDLMEVDDNRQSPEQLFDLVRDRVQASRLKLIELMEEHFWGISSANQTPKRVVGIVDAFPDPSNSTVSLQIGNPANYPGGLHGVDVADVDQFKAWGATYAGTITTDVLDKMKKIADYTRWKSPVNFQELIGNLQRPAIYTNLETKHSFENFLRNQNDNLGFELDPFSGQAMFRRTPIENVWQFDQDGHPWKGRNPILMLDWASIERHKNPNWWWKEIEIMQNPNFPTVAQSSTFCRFQTMYLDRRRNGLLINAAS